MKIISILLFASVIFTNCTNPETKLKVNKVKSIENTIKDTIQKAVFLKPDEIEVRIFFKELAHNYDEYYSGEKSLTTGKIREKKVFQKEKKCTFNTADCTGYGESCHLRENFEYLSIKGTGKNVSITVMNNKKVIFENDKIDLNGEFKLTKNEIKLLDTETKYKVIIKQGDNLLFEGDIEEDTQNCYHG